MTTTKIVGACIARNEAHRYLERCLQNALSLCDKVILLDDNSHDDTAALAERLGCIVHRLDAEGNLLTDAAGNDAAGNEGLAGGGLGRARGSASSASWWPQGEASRRELLWRLAAEEAGPEGWLYFFDADHELLGLNRADIAALCAAEHINAWAFPLYDCWDSPETMRVDGMWQAHLWPRPWLVRALPTPGFEPHWSRDGLHVGHLPSNYPIRAATGPYLTGIRHLAYTSATERHRKHHNYLQLRDRMSDAEIAHAESILEPATLAPIPQAAQPRILIASPIRKPPVVLNAFFQAIAWQEVAINGKPVHPDVLLAPNFAEGDTYAAEGLALCKTQQGEGSHFARPDLVTVWPNAMAPTGDYGEAERTRAWSKPAFERLAAFKDTIIEYALSEGYDYLWLIDADVLCDPYTLQSLIDSSAPVVAGVYWTNWSRPNSLDRAPQHAGPQVWLTGSYGLSGRGWTEPDFRAALVARQRLRVWGLGACTLFERSVLEKGVRFQRRHDMPLGPMSDGEDRQLCQTASQLHVPMYADAWPDIYHAYHPDEYGMLGEELEALGSRRALRHVAPRHGWLVSALLRNLEMPQVPAQFLRGRMGALQAHPQVEEALANMKPGERRLVKLHFPAHWPASDLRLRSLVFEITLLDTKPYRLPPVIDSEMLTGGLSSALVDTTSMTARQLAELTAEEA